MRLVNHPVHPMLVHFPVVAWTGAVAMDWSIRIWGFPILAMVGSGCVAAGLAMGALAMLPGFIDYTALPSQHPAQKTAVAHLSVMGMAWLLFLISLILRAFAPEKPPSILTVVADAAGFIVMLFGAWLGGTLVYHFRVGVDRD